MTSRCQFFKRVISGMAVVAASPMAILAPRTWRRVKDWRDDYLLTPEQAERFVQIVLNKAVISKSAKILPLVRFRKNVVVGVDQGEGARTVAVAVKAEDDGTYTVLAEGTREDDES